MIRESLRNDLEKGTGDPSVLIIINKSEVKRFSKTVIQKIIQKPKKAQIN